MGFGHINMFSDSDGTLRWEALAIANGDLLTCQLTYEGSL